MNPIIIDTDAGHDDALAMMLMLGKRPKDIVAITTVAGNSNINNVTRNAYAVLDLIGHTNIPVYSGHEKPLVRELVQAVVHGESGLDGLDMSQTQYTLDGKAPEKIVELAHQHKGNLEILTLGPLTNVARALALDPSIDKLIKRVTIMGGAINVAGNKNRTAEFNIFVDPEAADITLRASFEKILVPLDPCNDIILPLAAFDKLKGNRLYPQIHALMEHFIAGIEADEGTKGALVYDALAAYYLINPAAFTLKPMDVLVETKGEHTSGMTVAEKRLKAPKNYNTLVAETIDEELFLKDLLDALCSF